jgi:uncharacterized membrane protein
MSRERAEEVVAPNDDGAAGDTSNGSKPSGHSVFNAGDEPPLHLIARLRNYFLTGLVVAGPLTVTLSIVWWFVNLIDSWVKPVMPDFYAWLRGIVPTGYLPPEFTIPGFGLLFAVAGLTFIGALAANLLGRTLLSYTELFVGGLPFVRSVYKPVKQIFETVLSKGNSNFRKAGLIEFPRKGMWSLVFIAGDTQGEVASRLRGNGEFATVFMPSCPPTSGFLMFVPRSELIVLEMTVEEAAKMVLSAGIVTPEVKAQLVAQSARRQPAEVPRQVNG